jgi:prepilin-type N-terminal cleavage/methylation domain-containing protein
MRPGDDGRARRAFSLIELLAVLVVVSLAASVILPRLPATGTVRIRAAAARTADRLSAAREEAILGAAPSTSTCATASHPGSASPRSTRRGSALAATGAHARARRRRAAGDGHPDR